MGSVIQDVRYAFRGLLREPGFTAIVLLTVAIGTGANATVFSFIDALLFQTPAGVRGAGLVSAYTSDFSSTPYGDTSYSDFLSLRDDSGAFASLAAVRSGDVAVLHVGDVAERVTMNQASGDLFGVLGLEPAAGRLIAAEDARPGAPPAAVISDRLWRRAFAGDLATIGTPITLNGSAYTVVGVLPPRFDGLELGRRVDLWTPLVPPPPTPGERGDRGLLVVGRLAAGVTAREAQTRLNVLAANLAKQFPETNLGTLGRMTDPRPFAVMPYARLDPDFRGELSTLGLVMIAATVIVLAIACANVAGLLLSRATARVREMAVRLALGASRGRLVRQLLTESVVIACLGGALGILFALWTAGLLPSFFPPEIAELVDARIEGRTVAFIAAISLVSAGLFGIVPAFQARRPAAAAALRTQATGFSERGRAPRARSTFVVIQVALSCVLLVVTGLLVQSLGNQWRADLGFAARQVAIHAIETPGGDDNRAIGVAYYRDALDRVRHVPGVESAAWVRTLPLDPANRRGFRIDTYQPKPDEDMEFPINIVSPRYFETLQMTIVEGRDFGDADGARAPMVAIVNDELARRYFGGKALGRRLLDANDREMEIVGVVRTGRYRSLQDAPAPMVYYPLAQSYAARMMLVTRTAADPAKFLELLRKSLRSADGRIAIYRTLTMDAHLTEVFATDRLAAALVGTCGVMAVILAMVGVYGVMAYAVARRTREIGLRLALGAPRRHVLRLIAREGLWLTMLGCGAGVLGAAVSTRLVQSMLYGVSTLDLRVFTIAPAALAVVAMIAALVPARRALQIDPMTVLRRE